MPKFNTSLMQKVEEEEKEQRKQERLKQETGIEDEDIHLKERGAKDYAVSFLKGILWIVFTIFVFLGIAVLINTDSRTILFSLLPFAL